ncbi:hypothetical protein BDZ91DRAFT_780097 [Kalaharituber pfeilii]|nr:hypothetical protein BDZ91DRAFT_780097 [Kalaharituber pfeilii]
MNGARLNGGQANRTLRAAILATGDRGPGVGRGWDWDGAFRDWLAQAGWASTPEACQGAGTAHDHAPSPLLPPRSRAPLCRGGAPLAPPTAMRCSAVASSCGRIPVHTAHGVLCMLQDTRVADGGRKCPPSPQPASPHARPMEALCLAARFCCCCDHVPNVHPITPSAPHPAIPANYISGPFLWVLQAPPPQSAEAGGPQPPRPTHDGFAAFAMLCSLAQPFLL